MYKPINTMLYVNNVSNMSLKANTFDLTMFVLCSAHLQFECCLL